MEEGGGGVEEEEEEELGETYADARKEKASYGVLVGFS